MKLANLLFYSFFFLGSDGLGSEEEASCPADHGGQSEALGEGGGRGWHYEAAEVDAW